MKIKDAKNTVNGIRVNDEKKRRETIMQKNITFL